MKSRLIASFLLIAMLFVFTSSAAAQSDYSFSLDREIVQVFWNADGSLALDYQLTFTNDASGHPIDFVDMGMPNGNYDLSTVSADVGGQSVDVSTSDYQGSGSGFAVVMGSQTIPSGGSGTVHVSVGKITGVLYKDTTNPDTDVSGDFAPAYWTTAHSNTDMTVAFHLPPGVTSQEPRYHNTQGGWPCGDQPATALDSQNRVTYTWQCASANGSTQYTFGASFPKKYIPASAIVVPATFDFGKLFSNLGSNLQPFCCIGFFLLMFVGAPILGAINAKKRKLDYLPPKVQIEGHGIKRGLTAVEAAILMEEPLDKVMTMILFGVVKKNAASVKTRDPLELQVTNPPPTDLHDYEKDFLQAFTLADLAGRRKGLQDMTIKLVNSVSDKMKGFSRKETIAYYQNIMEQAWQQIEAAGTPEVKSQIYDQSLEWTMLDKNYDDRTRRVFTGPIFLPMWWGSFDPGYRPVSTGSVTSASTPSSGGRSSLPGAAFAASVVGGVQGFSSKVLGDVKSFTNSVTTHTNPVPVVKSSSIGGGGFHGGGGCACACACAGCACACAGGGR
ncbi:MAG: hypothetical protein ABSF99_13600 [Anaerolineales bacterium]